MNVVLTSHKIGMGLYKPEDRQVETSTTSPSAIKLALEWLDDCIRNHPGYNRSIVALILAKRAGIPVGFLV